MPPASRYRGIYQGSSQSPIGRVIEAAFIDFSRGLPRDTMRHLGSYAAVYAWRAAGWFKDARGLVHRVRDGDLILVFPDVGHSYYPGEDEQWSEIFFMFDGPVFDLWRASGVLDPARPIVNLQPTDHWLHRFSTAVSAECDAATALLQQVCRVQQVLADALAQHHRPAQTPDQRIWLHQAQTLLEQADTGAEIDWEGISRACGMSYEGFRKRFTHLAGTSPGRYHMTRLISRACPLLRSGHTNRDVAESLGFCDEYHFSRRFKQIMGLSPTEFRRRLP